MPTGSTETIVYVAPEFTLADLARLILSMTSEP
jgi:hypothetical protein